MGEWAVKGKGLMLYIRRQYVSAQFADVVYRLYVCAQNLAAVVMTQAENLAAKICAGWSVVFWLMNGLEGGCDHELISPLGLLVRCYQRAIKSIGHLIVVICWDSGCLIHSVCNDLELFTPFSP